MISYRCDRCGRTLQAEQDVRYVVKMEVFAATDPPDADDPDDRDHLLEIHEMLERTGDDEDQPVGDDVYRRLRMDLCPDCYRRFVKDPLGREVASQFDFSKN